MNCLRNICTFILIPWLSLSLYAQDYLFDARLYTTDDGLANLKTNAILQDSKGYLWIGTEYGLNRYDGYIFQLYTKEQHGLYANTPINQIHEDEKGNLWLIYTTGTPVFAIDVFNPLTQKAISLETYLADALPFKLKDLYLFPVKDPKNRLWVATKDGLLYTYQDGAFQQKLTINTTKIDALTVDEQENIWIANKKKLWCHNTSGIIDSLGSLPGLITRITVEKEGLWVTTKEILDVVTPTLLWFIPKESKTIQPFLLKKGGQHLKPRRATRSQQGFWYTILNERIQLFDEHGEWMFDFHNLLPEGMETGFHDDFETDDYLWLSSPAGLLKTSVRKNPFQLIHQRNGLSDCRTITEDKAGNIYFLDRQLYRWYPKEQQALPVIKDYATRGLIYADTVFWVSHYGTTVKGYQYNLKTHEKTSYPTEKGIGVLTAIKTGTPNRFLIGTNGAGVGYIDLTLKLDLSFEKYNGFDQLKEANVYHFYKNKAGIWIATSNGLFLMDEKKGVVAHFSQVSGGLPFDFIRHIHEDKDGFFWLATKGGGIIKWKLKAGEKLMATSQQITTLDGLSNNYTYAIYGDDYGKLWIPSDKGLMCLDKKTMEVRTYLMEDGLPHNEFNSTSHFKATDGMLYFGGLGGIIRFHPKDFANSRTLEVPLQFIGYSVLEEDAEFVTDKSQLIQEVTQITIKPTDKFARLDFSLLDYDDPTQHSYAYKIEGYSEQWNYISENYVPINSLPYGNYQLRIKGRNNSKGWTNQDLSLDLVVEKPFYLQTWFIVLMGIVILTMLFAIIKHRLHRLERDRERLETEVKKRTKTIREQAEQLKELDKAKTRFFSNITHEFRTPLTLIIGPLEQIMEEKPTGSRLNSVLRNAKHLLGLINQMLDLSKLEGGQMKVELKQGDIINYTQVLIQQIKPLADKKEQQIQFNCSKKVWKTQFDNKKWNKIIYNLLSNAIKFTPEQGQIVIDLAIIQETNQIQLLVKDTGVGIETDKLSNIFNRFYQTDDSSTRYQEGTGIGLALVKELVELQDGSIIVESELGVGTTFKILLPILARIEAEIVEDVPALQPIKATIPTAIVNIPVSKGESSTAIEKLTLLIIEDNEEMRTYIKNCISTKNYVIEEAKNGIEGIEIAQNLIPDLIISDVMMPGKDGFEVTDFIRNNKATSHIPIILLTAKAALESRLEGIQKGADVYLTKPFSPTELRLRIEKLIEIRQLIQQNVDESSLNPVYPIYEKENLFIQEIKWIIINNIDNKNLNGEFIGQQIGMSRMQVHRKMKALINQSASDMIKDMRLQNAYELLLTRNYNSSEVAYQSGFNSLAYFSKSFKEKFGYSPSEVLKKNMV